MRAAPVISGFASLPNLVQRLRVVPRNPDSAAAPPAFLVDFKVRKHIRPPRPRSGNCLLTMGVFTDLPLLISGTG